MLPLVWIAISPAPHLPIDNDTINELHMSFSTLLWHNETVDLHVVARATDFDKLNYTVKPPSRLTFHNVSTTYVHTTFAHVGITGWSHHSKVGGACKLLLPALVNMSTFIFFDTDIVFLRPVSTLMEVVTSMESHHIIAASLINGLGFRQRINSGLMIFNNVNAQQWVHAILGALMLNPLNCDPFHWGPYQRPVCIRHGTHVGGDQEVISVVVSATYSLYPLPSHAHSHIQGNIDVNSIPDDLITLHYKRREEVAKLVKHRLAH